MYQHADAILRHAVEPDVHPLPFSSLGPKESLVCPPRPSSTAMCLSCFRCSLCLRFIATSSCIRMTVSS